MRRTWTLRTERPEAGFEPRTSLLCLGTVLTTKLPVNNQRADWSPETAAAHVALQQHSHLDIWWAVSLCLICVLILFEPEFIWPHYAAQSFIIWLKKNIFHSFKTCLWLLVVFLLSCWLQLSCREVSVVQRCIASSFSSPGHKSNYFLLYVLEEMQSA